MTEPVLDTYLEKEVVIFIEGHDMAGEFVGYDDQAYYLMLHGSVITVNRRFVEMIIPAQVWEKIKEEENV